MRSSRVFAKQLPHTRLYLDLASFGAPEGTNVRKVDSVKQRQDVTHALLIHCTPDAAFIYPWRSLLTHRFPWLSVFVRHYSE